MSLIEKLKKGSKLTKVDVLGDSEVFKPKEVIKTEIPMLNVALGGSFDGGLTPGLITLAAPSKHYKTGLSLVMAKAYMDKFKDAVLLFYDSEFGTPQAYFKNVGIDPTRVLHSPFTDLEELKFDIVSQLENISENDHVIIVVDSIGNAASRKEVEDTLNEKSVADMTRAKALKSLFRMITPKLTLKGVTMIAISHTYDSMGMFPTKVVSGGTGIMYSSNIAFVIGRRQVKKGQEIVGYDFVLNVEKSRFVKEKSSIPLNITWENGIDRYSGLLDIALETGFVACPSSGWYAKVDKKTGEVVLPKKRAADLDAEFWEPLLKDKDFKAAVEKIYKI